MSQEERLIWGEVSFSLLRIYGILRREEKVLAAQYQLGTAHVEILYLINRISSSPEGWLPVPKLYPYLPITQPAAGRLLKHLAYWKFIDLIRDRGDRRRLLVRLSDRGRALLEEIDFQRARLLQKLFPSLSGEQLHLLATALRSRTFAEEGNRHVESSMGLHP